MNTVSLNTNPADPALPLIKPDPKCPSCHGSGFIRVDGGNRKCTCLLKQEALRYLGPTYAGARYIKTLDPAPLRGKNILFSADVSTFKSIVKSFLLNTAMNFAHDTKSAYDVMQAYLSNSETGEFSRLQRIDLLILYLVADPHNKSYSNVLVSLLERRQYLNLPTWIYAANAPSTDRFTGLYGFELADHIKTKFQLLKP